MRFNTDESNYQQSPSRSTVDIENLGVSDCHIRPDRGNIDRMTSWQKLNDEGDSQKGYDLETCLKTIGSSKPLDILQERRIYIASAKYRRKK